MKQAEEVNGTGRASFKSCWLYKGMRTAMKLPFVLGTVVVGVALTGWAQVIEEAKPLKPRPSNEFKVKENATADRPSHVPAPAARLSPSERELRRVEAEHPKPASSTKKLPVASIQDNQKSSPKINFSAKSEKKSQLTQNAPDPLKGRLKEKGQHR